MIIWILNGTHRTPGYHLLGLARQACPEVFLEEDADPDDPDALTSPLMYEAGPIFYAMCMGHQNICLPHSIFKDLQPTTDRSGLRKRIDE